MFFSSQDGIETSSTWPHFILNLRFFGVGPGLGHGSLKGISKKRQGKALVQRHYSTFLKCKR